MRYDVAATVAVPLSLAWPLQPGTSSGCWQLGYTYEICCLRSKDANCFGPESGFDETRCCSGMLEGIVTPRGGISRATGSWTGVKSCAERAKEEAASRSSEETLAGNSFLETLACMAALPSVDVVLDTFLGGGCSCGAIAKGLSAPRARKRPPAVAAFEKYQDQIEKALKRLGEMSLLSQQPPKIADIRAEKGEGIPLSDAYKEKLYSYQQFMLQGLRRPPGSDEEPPQILIAHGTALVHNSMLGYAWNALDIACQHLAPVDLVVIDQDSEDVTREWMIIETVCRPRLVALFNVNIHGGGSWIKNRLEVLGNWQLEARGVVELGREKWLSMAEVRRLRAWAIFSSLME